MDRLIYINLVLDGQVELIICMCREVVKDAMCGQKVGGLDHQYSLIIRNGIFLRVGHEINPEMDRYID